MFLSRGSAQRFHYLLMLLRCCIGKENVIAAQNDTKPYADCEPRE